MAKVLVVDNSRLEGDRIKRLLAQQGLEGEICLNGGEAQRMIESRKGGFEAALILWDIAGPPSGFELLALCTQRAPAMPTIVMSGSLDATLAARAFALGAKDFLEKPLDSERLKSCLESILAVGDPLSPLVMRLRESLLGDSLAFISTLKQVARVVPYDDLSVLLIGESGTGKELLARAIHQLGSRAGHAWVAVNVGEIAPTLIESALFGHEKGAFTGATDRHVGFFEEANSGTLFLDEIGDLALSLQGKLLRVIQEKEFRRLKGQKTLPFKARLVCATNHDLVAAVNKGSFRRDLFHRIAEVTIQIPPLRDREGDVELLLRHFMGVYGEGRSIRFARETLSILRSYTYPGNIRELENLVRAAIVGSDDDLVLPKHLPLQSMRAFLEGKLANEGQSKTPGRSELPRLRLFEEIEKSLPENWLELSYRETFLSFEHAFDRVYLQYLLERAHHNITRAASEAGVDSKTFRKRWRECGLPSLVLGEGTQDG
jgi:DNA-binding NtrC family response regulator